MCTKWNAQVDYTCSVHRLDEGIGNDRYINASNFTDLWSQDKQRTMDLNCPWNNVTMMDWLSLWWYCQEISAALWSGKFSKSSSFRYSLFLTLCKWITVKIYLLNPYESQLEIRKVVFILFKNVSSVYK